MAISLNGQKITYVAGGEIGPHFWLLESCSRCWI